METTQFRTLHKKDFPQVRKLISDIWNFERYTNNPKLLDVFAGSFLDVYLLNQNYTRVAVENDKITGLLIGRCESLSVSRKPRYLFSLLKNLAYLHISKQGRRIASIQKRFAALSAKLFDEVDDTFDAELVLILTAPIARGRGIGKKLLYDFNAFLKAHGSHSVCLITDSFCNYRFYDRLGYTRAAASSGITGAEPCEDSFTAFYLYTYQL
ncbi:MAG: GNAT family N-acetyltransferase [Christensenella sp.]|nr:GNAT family N-acetyltransferase [Christensenella sp.]